MDFLEKLPFSVTCPRPSSYHCFVHQPNPIISKCISGSLYGEILSLIRYCDILAIEHLALGPGLFGLEFMAKFSCIWISFCYISCCTHTTPMPGLHHCWPNFYPIYINPSFTEGKSSVQRHRLKIPRMMQIPNGSLWVT